MITVEDPQHIDDIVDVIHDAWFELSRIDWDRATAIVAVPLEREAPDRAVRTGGRIRASYTIPIVVWILKIHAVVDCHVADTAGVGRVDLNEVRYDPSLQELIIETDVPSDIRLKVSQFRLTLEDSGIARERVVKRLFAPS